MPKVARRPVSFIGWALLATFAAWALYVIWRHPLLSIAFIALVAGWSVVSNRRDRAHFAALSAQRSGESICSFAREEGCRSADTWIVRAAYEEIQDHLAPLFPEFPLRCGDRIVDDLRIDPDDLDELLAINIAERTSRDMTDTTRNPYFGRVQTVRDLIMFFQSQPKLPEAQ
jgi:hypothetical protein